LKDNPRAAEVRGRDGSANPSRSTCAELYPGPVRRSATSV